MQTAIAIEFQDGFGRLPGYGALAMPEREKECGKVAVMDQQTSDDWAELVERVHRSKDRTAFAALFRHFAPRVKSFLLKSGASEYLAEECTQEVMATLWTKAHMFDPSRASVSTWVYTIARNRKIDALRRQRRPEPEDLTWGPEHEPDQHDVLALRQESEKGSSG